MVEAEAKDLGPPSPSTGRTVATDLRDTQARRSECMEKSTAACRRLARRVFREK